MLNNLRNSVPTQMTTWIVFAIILLVIELIWRNTAFAATISILAGAALIGIWLLNRRKKLEMLGLFAFMGLLLIGSGILTPIVLG